MATIGSSGNFAFYGEVTITLDDQGPTIERSARVIPTEQLLAFPAR